MASENILTQVRKGMEMHSSDGVCLGKVAQVWWGTDPRSSTARCDETQCSRLEVHQRRGLRKSVLYVPYNAIAEVTAKQVVLNVDEETAKGKGWASKPRWILVGRGVEVPHGYEHPGSLG